MERHFPFPYATPQIYASPGCNAENSNFNMKTQREILFLESFLPFGKSNSNMKTLGFLRECFFLESFPSLYCENFNLDMTIFGKIHFVTVFLPIVLDNSNFWFIKRCRNFIEVLLLRGFCFHCCVCLFVLDFLIICLFAGGAWERVDPRQKLLVVALVVLNCLQPLSKTWWDKYRNSITMSPKAISS